MPRQATSSAVEGESFEWVPWSNFLRAMQFRQGEHVTMVAPTGQGKTTLAREIVTLRDHVMVLATKKRDDTLQQFRGYDVTTNPRDDQRRVIIYPPFPKDSREVFKQHAFLFHRILNRVYQQGGWCVLADEVRYLSETLKLKSDLELLWLQGRSLGVSLVALTQRPRHIPVEAYDQATHLFLWRDTDMGNVERIADIGGVVDRRAIMARVPHLPEHQFIYVDTRHGQVFESKVEV